jgi:hypothetical protein
MALAERAELVAHLDLDDDLTPDLDRKIRGIESNLDGIERKADTTGTALKGVGTSAALGAAAGAAAYGLLDQALGRVVGLIGTSAAAFREDAASIALLNTALKANVEGWDGTTTAIDAVIKSRERLGFTDEQQRQSLALAVVATNDITAALEIQAAAMDLARLKGISLQAATEALIRVEGGQYRLLTSLGIALQDNATQQQALTAVRAAAQGQAEALANTEEGRLLAATIKVDEAVEKLGATTSKVGSVALPILADGLDTLIKTLEGVTMAADTANNPLNTLIRAVLPGVAIAQDTQIIANRFKPTSPDNPLVPGTARSSAEGGFGTGGLKPLTDAITTQSDQVEAKLSENANAITGTSTSVDAMASRLDAQLSVNATAIQGTTTAVSTTADRLSSTIAMESDQVESQLMANASRISSDVAALHSPIHGTTSAVHGLHGPLGAIVGAIHGIDVRPQVNITNRVTSTITARTVSSGLQQNSRYQVTGRTGITAQ